MGPTQLAEVRRRIGKPLMLVDMPEQTIEQHRAASIVLYYSFSTLVQYEALDAALKNFNAGPRPGDQAAFEDFIGYREYEARAAKYRG